MQRLIIGFSLTGSLIIFGLSSGLFENALMFVLFGIVPGASESVAPNIMMAFWATLAGFLSGRLSQRLLTHVNQDNTTQSNQLA